jgi:PQQ-like domain
VPRRSARVRPIAPIAVFLVLVAVASATFPGAASAVPGAQLWMARFNGGGTSSDGASAVGVSPDGSAVFATGWTGRSGEYPDYATVAYDATTGAELWVARYDGPGHSYDLARALGVSPDGSTVYVTGQSFGTATNSDYGTVAYDASTGAELWTARYDGARNGPDAATALRVSPNGSAVFVTGGSFGSGQDYTTVAYHASTGVEVWAKRYDGPAHLEDVASALEVSPDGTSVFVTGRSTTRTRLDYGTVSYDAVTGARAWVKHSHGRRIDTAVALAMNPDGSTVFVTGTSVGATPGGDVITVAYEASSGAKLWGRRYDRARSDTAADVEVSPDGATVFVTGASVRRSTSGFDYVTIAYDAATGATRWAARYERSRDDLAMAVGVNGDATVVVVTGVSIRVTTDGDYATVAYDATTGAELWVERYHGRANGFDQATALAVSPNGSAVFVTGSSLRAASSHDFTTLAYSLT